MPLDLGGGRASEEQEPHEAQDQPEGYHSPNDLLASLLATLSLDGLGLGPAARLDAFPLPLVGVDPGRRRFLPALLLRHDREAILLQRWTTTHGRRF